MPIDFIPLTKNHLSLLHQWFQEPLVKKWYARDKTFSLEEIKEKYLPRIQGKDNTPSYIVQINNEPIGFIQYYILCEHLPEGVMAYTNKLFANTNPEKIGGIDLFIAAENFRGKGIGAEIINQFIVLFLNEKFEMVVVDPAADNINAIHCFTRCGFWITNYSEDPQYVLMTRQF